MLHSPLTPDTEGERERERERERGEKGVKYFTDACQIPHVGDRASRILSKMARGSRSTQINRIQTNALYECPPNCRQTFGNWSGPF